MSTATETEAITTHSIWVPSSGNDPYLRQQQSPWKRDTLAREFEPPQDWPNNKAPIESFWNQERTFPRPSIQSSAPPTLPDLGTTSEFVDDFFRDGPFVPETILDKLGGQEFKDASGWNDWPSPEKTPDFHEGVVVEAFIKFLNTTIKRIGLSRTRLAIDCQKSGVMTYDGGILEPDVVVWANDSGTYPYMEGMPSSKPLEKQKRPNLKRPRDDPGDEAPEVEWLWCLIPIEFKTEAGRRPKDNYVQIATYAREVLVAQPNRRFVPSFLMTETHFEFILWDRAGAVISKRVDYHKHFSHFCSMLANILSWSPDRVGFDTTICHSMATPSNGTPLASHAVPLSPHVVIKADVEETDSEGRPTIKTLNYAADEILFRAYTVRGRGTTCWRAHKFGDPSDRYLILDSWTKGGSREERNIYDKIQKVKSKGLIEFVTLHDIQLSGPDLSTTYLDDIRTIRGGDKYLKNDLNLIHTRTVLRCDALPLGRWSSIEELVRTLRDAIEGITILLRVPFQSNAVPSSSQDIVPGGQNSTPRHCSLEYLYIASCQRPSDSNF